jgi:hypothetical protein
MYHVLDRGNNTSNANTTVTQTAAAATTGSTLGNTYQATAIPPELTAAINTILANQQFLYQYIALLSQQMAALSFHAQLPTQACQPALHTPPIQHLAIPGLPAYGGNHGGYQHGYQQGRCGGRSTGHPRNGRNNNRRGHGCTPFADHMAAQSCGYGGGTSAFPPTGGITQQPFQSNLVKQHNNWNGCYLCGFDVEDNHTSMTCPLGWRKPPHDVTLTRDNAQTFLAMGCNACTEGMHKTLLPRNF